MEVSNDNQRQSEQYQVIIIGAGISGLAAARHLLQNGITNILILEATSKAGGRINTQSFGEFEKDEALVELGAQWVHGEDNPFCQLIKDSNHRHRKTSWEGKGDFLCSNGTKIDAHVITEVLTWIEDSIEQVEDTLSIETLQKSCESEKSESMSMGRHLLENFTQYLKETYPGIDKDSDEYEIRMALFQWGMSFQRIDNSCDKMNQVSLYRWSEFQVNPGEHYNNFAHGAQSFVDNILVGDLNIVYNAPVTNICWNSDTHPGVKISTQTGDIYTAQIVLVTCSIGVLKLNLDALFTPNLPEAFSTAIHSTGYGPVTKLFLTWAKPWWPTDLQGYQFLWPKEYINCCDQEETNDNRLRDTWHKTITGFDPVLDNPNTLLAWLGGPEAVWVETMEENDIAQKCTQLLTDFTGLQVPAPVAVAVSKWNTHKYFQGAYSFRSVDGDKVEGDICAKLCKPICTSSGTPAIFFAGEALSKSHYSTLHGAYESGISQADRIFKYFQSSSENLKTLSTQDAKVKISSASSFKDKTMISSNLRADLVYSVANIQVPS